jgi:hypothetical protein
MSISRAGTRRLTAKKTSRCSCGCYVHEGDALDWDVDSRRTVGCRACNFTGEDPAPGDHGDGGFGDDDYQIFHDKG